MPHIWHLVLVVGIVLSAYATAYAAQAGHRAWLGFLALLPLFSAIRVLRPLAAAGCGALWAISLAVFLHLTGGETSVVSAGSLVAIGTCYTGLSAALTGWIGFSPFVLGVGWMGVELALSPLGLHNGLLSASQSDTALMDHLGHALGYVLVAFLVAYVNAALVAVLGRVHLTAPRFVPTTTLPDCRWFLGSQILGCLSLVFLQPSQPRAPPV